MSSGVINKVNEDYYLYAEAAIVLGISKMGLWKRIKAGKLEVHRIGREVLIEKKAVDALRK